MQACSEHFSVSFARLSKFKRQSMSDNKCSDQFDTARANQATLQSDTRDGLHDMAHALFSYRSIYRSSAQAEHWLQ